jgi:hypothetical protein
MIPGRVVMAEMAAACDWNGGFPSRTGSIYTAWRAVRPNIQPELPHPSLGCPRGDIDDALHSFIV